MFIQPRGRENVRVIRPAFALSFVFPILSEIQREREEWRVRGGVSQSLEGRLLVRDCFRLTHYCWIFVFFSPHTFIEDLFSAPTLVYESH